MMNREAIEQEIGKRFEKIEKTLERTLEKTLEKAIGKAAEFANSPTGTRVQAKAEAAKKTVDDVLLGLEHKGYNVKHPQDLIQTVGRRVLERASEIAEDVRAQVAAQPYSPEWLKNVADVAATKVQKRARPDVAVETSVVADSSGVKTAGVEAVGATEGDGELAESAEDSAEEKAAGVHVESEPDIVTTSLAEASESNRAADFPKAGKTAKKSSKAKSSKK